MQKIEYKEFSDGEDSDPEDSGKVYNLAKSI